ncbi:protein lap4-like [Chenopodium quinoa]|uniref:Uncharacterized protein n=1 Tax=Chenopodium quinoa TaxID=63459 RepID=A0A803LWM6_CHEQI|nr:protein lap4-like [Chenopodium quinoa]
MSTTGARDQYVWSLMRKKWILVCSRGISPSGQLCLKGDPGPWIENNPASLLLVQCLELDFANNDVEGEIADSIRELSRLTHLYICFCTILKCLPNAITRLHNLKVLQVECCIKLEELPANISLLESLRHLSLSSCFRLNSVSSITGLHNLQKLDLRHCYNLTELPADLGDELLELFYIDIQGTAIKCLPGSITKLWNLRFLLLPWSFRLETLPYDLNESIVVAFADMHIRKTWNALRKEIAPLSFPLLGAEAAHNQCNCSYERIACPSIVFPWGYLQLKGDPGPWIHCHYDSHSLVRFLDLDLSCDTDHISESIGELAELTHLYIYNSSYLEHLPKKIAMLQKLELLSVQYCDVELPPDLNQLVSLRHLSLAANGVEPIIYGLEKLSNLETLNLQGSFNSLTELPINFDKLVSLRHLSLGYCEIKSLPVSITKLSNLTTLYLYECPSLKALLENSSFRRLKLKNCSIMTLPTGLCHLEILHFKDFCEEKTACDIQEQFLDHLINLETLSITCYRIKFLPSIARLRNLQELRLKDCFSLKELPANLDELIGLCILDISGTRIKSLPYSITKLNNLQCLILPKCFRLESLPSNMNSSVRVFVDNTDDTYYENLGYYDCLTSAKASTEGN